jgi:dTMP kinase
LEPPALAAEPGTIETMTTTALFIALEGTDGSGLSTQTERLAGWFRATGRPVHATKEPSGGPAGLLLRLALAHRLGYGTQGAAHDSDGDFRPLDEATLALLFAADRMDHLAGEVLPRLERGVAVVCDRYALSSYAYQGLGVDVDWLRALNARARPPDLTVFIDVPTEVGVERMRARGVVERYEQRETLVRVRDHFHRLIPALQAEGQRIAVVDGTLPPDAVHAAIVDRVAGSQPATGY